MRRETARREIETLDYYLQKYTNDYCEESHTAMMMAMDALSSSEKPNKWIPIVERPMTDEERKEYGAEIGFIYDCVLPEDCQDVLVTTPYGVRQTTFYTDYGCYFENYEDEGDVIAWMPLPEPYKAESENK